LWRGESSGVFRTFLLLGNVREAKGYIHMEQASVMKKVNPMRRRRVGNI
jgi:hypothetical protein